MVLYKRKQVHFVRPPPVPSDLDTEIFVIPQTKEWFLEYDDYLKRLDYYHRRKFVCEITGNSCLTFFEAYESENKEIKDVERNFPEALREHILRFLQFNRISRLDQLVDKVYLVFKNEYFPGEEVFVKLVADKPADVRATESNDAAAPVVSARKQRGTIREKVQYANPSDTKYLVSLLSDGSQVIATNNQITRDRNHFTKWLIKTFVKLSVTRSHKVGAPWVVKLKYAKKYRIPLEYPEDLKSFASTTPSGEILYEEEPVSRTKSPTPQQNSESALKIKKQKLPKTKSLKKKATINAAKAMDHIEIITVEEIKEPKQAAKDGPRKRFAPYHIPVLVRKELDEHEQLSLSSIQPSKKTMVNDLQLNFDIQTPWPIPSELHITPNAEELQESIKLQIEEEIEEEEKELGEQKGKEDKSPEQLLAHRKVEELKSELSLMSHSTLKCVQEALESWAFLNMYHLVFNLDTFTFDDFLCAMSWNRGQYEELGRCELLDEIWCAVLSGLLSNQIPTGKDAKKDESDYENLFGLQITLPPKDSLLQPKPEKGETNYSDDDEARGSDSEEEAKPLKSEDDVSDDDSGPVSPKKGVSRSNGYLKKGAAKDGNADGKGNESDDERDDNDNETGEESEANDDTDHLAYQVMNYRGSKWYDRLRKRNFKDGNWQIILLGVLSMVEYVPAYSSTIQAVYKSLAPKLIQPANPTSVLTQFYSSMSVDLRIKTLHILTSLLINGTLVRSYIDECLEQSTALRRARLDVIRDYRDALSVATKAHSTIFEKLFEAYDNNADVSLWANFNRKKPRFHTKGYSRTEYEQSLYDSDPSFQELWKQRDEYIEKIKVVKEELRKLETRLSEIDCQRVRLLGKDRHFNRYWWFENNGLPNLHFSSGMDDDEDADQTDADEYEVDDKEDVQEETYLMGRLWVQGPSVADISRNLLSSTDEMNSLEFNHTKSSIKKEDEDSVNGSSSIELHNFQDGGPPLKVMNFDNIPKSYKDTSSAFGITFERDEIKVNGACFIDRLGAIPETQNVSDLTPMQRKLIEEAPAPLTTGDDWRFYDDASSIEKLIGWLNPWGVRESNLKKELIRVKDALLTSIAARRKALWLDEIPKGEDDKIDEQVEAVEKKIVQLKSTNVSDKSEEETESITGSRKRANRLPSGRPNKKQKTIEETLESGSLEELTELQTELINDKEKKRIDNQVTRVLEWVNSKAQDAFDKTLYEGGEKAKPKPRKSRK
uniref:Imitation switch two complex 1 n=1 Tax=Candidozyma auris TaxID=498019 RepID=A0A0L0P7U2_CANAR